MIGLLQVKESTYVALMVSIIVAEANTEVSWGNGDVRTGTVKWINWIINVTNVDCGGEG